MEVPASAVSISGWVHAPDGSLLTDAEACLHPEGGDARGACTTTGRDGSFTQMFMGTPADSEKGQLEFVVTSPGSQPPPDVSVTIEPFMIAGVPAVRTPRAT